MALIFIVTVIFVSAIYLINQNNQDYQSSSAGKYVKAIGGGDLLFDEKTLSSVFEAMDRKGSLIAFGNMKTYKKNKNNSTDNPNDKNGS